MTTERLAATLAAEQAAAMTSLADNPDVVAASNHRDAAEVVAPVNVLPEDRARIATAAPTDEPEVFATLAMIRVDHGDGLHSFPYAARAKGGWQSGVHFYPDGQVVEVTPIPVAHTPAPGGDTWPTREEVAHAIFRQMAYLITWDDAHEDVREPYYAAAAAVLALFPAPDARVAALAETVTARTNERDQAREQLDRLHTWDGLMELLDEHWPEDIIPTYPPDAPWRDPGPRIVSLLRWVDRLTIAPVTAEEPR